MENHVKKMVIEYIKKNIGNYTDIKISNYSGKVTGILNYPHSKQPRKRVFIGWDNEFLAYIKEGKIMSPKYNINEKVYMLTIDLKIRPVLISGVKLTRSSEIYLVDLENKKGELINLEVDGSKLHLRPVDITFNIINEYNEWDRNQKEWEGK